MQSDAEKALALVLALPDVKRQEEQLRKEALSQRRVLLKRRAESLARAAEIELRDDGDVRKAKEALDIAERALAEKREKHTALVNQRELDIRRAHLDALAAESELKSVVWPRFDRWVQRVDQLRMESVPRFGLENPAPVNQATGNVSEGPRYSEARLRWARAAEANNDEVNRASAKLTAEIVAVKVEAESEDEAISRCSAAAAKLFEMLAHRRTAQPLSVPAANAD